MTGRTFALFMLFFGALSSFGLAMWSASQGRLPIVETAHALLFAVMGMVLASARGTEAPVGCRECGGQVAAGDDFCLHCGCYPKVKRVPRHSARQARS